MEREWAEESKLTGWYRRALIAGGQATYAAFDRTRKK